MVPKLLGSFIEDMTMHQQQTVRDISKSCFTDAVEALAIIEVIEGGNRNGCTEHLNAKGAGRAAGHIQRALFTRMHIIISRHYMPSRKSDLHARKAFDLLSNPDIRAGVTSPEREARLAQAEASWTTCNQDERLESYIHLRNKFLAHLGAPKPGIPIPMYGEVLQIARNTASCFNHLANGTGVVALEIETQVPAQRDSATAFWTPWLPA